MGDNTSKFELGWAPEMYPGLRDTDDGRWRLVLQDGEAVGVVWTNGLEAAGVSWILQTDAALKVNKHMRDGASVGTRAVDAYNTADMVPGVHLSKESSGKLSGVTDELMDIASDIA